jgi:hypothetical protein
MRDLEHATFTRQAVHHTSCVEPLYATLLEEDRRERLRLFEGAFSMMVTRPAR